MKLNFSPVSVLSIMLLLLSASANFLISQSTDSLKTNNVNASDTLTAISDTTLSALNSAADSLTLSDSTALPPADTLNPIYNKAFSGTGSYSSILSPGEIKKLDYRYTGNFISYLPGGYLFDLGHIGQPNEASFYGMGFNNISFMIDGLTRTNRLKNSFDLNLIQSQYVDSLEVFSLPRGFLYSSFNNPVTVNINTVDKIANVPTTKIRFFQGPDDEGYIGAAFSAYLMNRLAGSIDVTTYRAEDRFINSESVNWNLAAKLHYMPSNKINILGSYNYNETTTNLFGGIDVDSMRTLYNAAELEDEIFNPLSSIVQYGTESNHSLRYQKITAHNIAVKVLGKFNQFNSDLSLYYQFNNNEFRQNEYGRVEGIRKIFNDNRFKVFGISLKGDYKISIFDLQLLSVYETTRFKSPLAEAYKERSSFSIGGIGSARLIDSLLVPSVFAKSLNYNGSNFLAFGIDAGLNLWDELTFYAGASYIEKPLNIITETSVNPDYRLFALYDPIFFPAVEKNKIDLLEVGVKVKTEILKGKILFYQNNTNGLEPIQFLNDNFEKQNETGFFREADIETQGLSATFSFHISKVLLTSNFNWNLSFNNQLNAVPEFNFKGGIYYVDSLFNNNLDLKTGFSFTLLGKRNSFIYDFETSRQIFYQYTSSTQSFSLINNEVLGTDYQIDFFLAGTIQEAATVYFVWENLLGENYFQVAYYPQRARGIRLGVTWTLFD
ncbi:MAG: hypothetical protein HND52_11355 [Ignavibacteriae bacterium]|nr:hypothetical protein [Ignavibacteriota bacterium]NOG98545.1 hypothetical protein [Ignavibacteriota bacterium]